MRTLISPLTHSPDEHAIVAMPDTGAVERIVNIQRQLKSVLGDAIWLTPPNALHMTLMEIICNTEYKDLSRAEHFTNWYRKYNGPIKAVIGQFEPFTVTLSEIHASPAAIILKAADTKRFNHTRAALLRRTDLPPQTKLPPDITHCSIARYNEAIDLDAVREKIAAPTADIHVSINEFRLMKDLGPDFHPQVEDIYELGL